MNQQYGTQQGQTPNLMYFMMLHGLGEFSKLLDFFWFVNLKDISNQFRKWIKRFVYPFQWGLPTFSVAGFVAILSGVMASIIESIGDYYACADISGTWLESI